MNKNVFLISAGLEDLSVPGVKFFLENCGLNPHVVYADDPVVSNGFLTEQILFYLIIKDGILKAEYASTLKAKNPGASIICLCAGSCLFNLEGALVHKADGFLSLASPGFEEDLKTCLFEIGQNRKFFQAPSALRADLKNKLSDVQWFVIRYIASGFTNSDVAKTMTMAVPNVRYHINTIKEKMNFTNLADLIAWTTLRVARVNKAKVLAEGDLVWRYFRRKSKSKP